MPKPAFEKIRLAHAFLAERHPDLFSLDKPLPFKIGISIDVQARYPELKRWAVFKMFGWLTSRRAYLAACAAPGVPRYGLEGEFGEVGPGEAAHARRRFVERNARAVDPWPAERFAA